MAHNIQFEKTLNDLFQKRSAWIRDIFNDQNISRPPKIKRKTINESITKLQNIAKHAFANKLAKEQFNKHVNKKKSWHIKGYRREEKKNNFKIWFNREFPREKNLIYAFWNNKNQCIYIGRTGNGGSRPQSHFEKIWFPRVKRIDIYSSKAGQIPKLECLAKHHFEPKENKNKPAKKKWTKQCPLCQIDKDIKSELHKMFRLK